MATVQPGPSNGSTGLTRTAPAPPAATDRQLPPPLDPQPGGKYPHYSVLLSTGS